MIITAHYHLFLDVSVANFFSVCIISKCHCLPMEVLDLDPIMHSFPKLREASQCLIQVLPLTPRSSPMLTPSFHILSSVTSSIPLVGVSVSVRALLHKSERKLVETISFQKKFTGSSKWKVYNCISGVMDLGIKVILSGHHLSPIESHFPLSWFIFRADFLTWYQI